MRMLNDGDQITAGQNPVPVRLRRYAHAAAGSRWNWITAASTR